MDKLCCLVKGTSFKCRGCKEMFCEECGLEMLRPGKPPQWNGNSGGWTNIPCTPKGIKTLEDRVRKDYWATTHGLERMTPYEVESLRNGIKI